MDIGRDGTTVAATGEEEVVAVAVVMILATMTPHHLTLARTTATSLGARAGAVHSEGIMRSKAGARIGGVPLEELPREQQRVTVSGGWAGTTITTVAGMGTTAAPGAVGEGARRGPARQGRAVDLASAVLATRVRASVRQVVARSLVYFQIVN